MKRLGFNSQKGAVLVFVALMLPIMVFFGGMAIDFGRAYMYKSQLQNAADAAALAGVAAAAPRRKTRLVEDPAKLEIVNDANQLSKAKDAANDILIKDTGKASANAENTSLGHTSENDAYYYKVELTDEVKMIFAQFFLPQSLFPNDWKIKVSARAWARAGTDGANPPPDGPNKLDQTAQAVTENTTEDFFDWENELKQIFREHFFDWEDELKQIFEEKDDLRTRAQRFSFTNDGVQYDEYGNRSEVFNMDDSIKARNQMKDFFINFKQDVYGAVTNNFDVTDLRELSYLEARDLFYADDKKFENIILPDGTFIAGPITWDGLIRRFGSQIGTKNSSTWQRLTDKKLSNRLNWEDISESEREIVWNALTSKITAQINVNVAYDVRNVDGLSAREVSLTPTGERNYQDPLFVRIESEEFNASGVSNTIHDININIKADNTDNNYRPIVFAYDGPKGDKDGGRESGTVVLNLQEDFKGIIYAPNSPVQVIGNGKAFRGYIIAKRIIGPNGKDLTDDMPTNQNSETDATLQKFYKNLGLREGGAKYDNFDVVRLNVYKNPDKDIIYITERAKITI